MDNITGTPVRGGNLKFRDTDVREIIGRLTTGSVLLIGLRRIGKTSVMLGVKDRMSDTWITTYHDLEGVQNPANFFSVLLIYRPLEKSLQQKPPADGPGYIELYFKPGGVYCQLFRNP